MPGLSIHVVDVSRGLLADGMRVRVSAIGDDGTASLVVEGKIGANGLLADPSLERRFNVGHYRAEFEVAAYYRASGVALPSVPFLDRVVFDFGIDQPDQHYHLPFKCTPWGYSCFRGGA